MHEKNRPDRAKASPLSLGRAIIGLLPCQGEYTLGMFTQGDALGYGLTGLSGLSPAGALGFWENSLSLLPN